MACHRHCQMCSIWIEALVESEVSMTASMTLFSVIADTNDWCRDWWPRVISNESFIAFESLFSKGLFSIN
jgi:hypothetical protein